MNQGDKIIKFGELVKAGHPPELCARTASISIPRYGYDALNWDDCEVALAFVQRKPVYVGDELCHEDFGKVKIVAGHIEWLGFTAVTGDYMSGLSYFSWSPPKPKTGTIELPWEDIESLAGGCSISNNSLLGHRLYKACRKTLKEAK